MTDISPLFSPHLTPAEKDVYRAAFGSSGAFSFTKDENHFKIVACQAVLAFRGVSQTERATILHDLKSILHEEMWRESRFL